MKKQELDKIARLLPKTVLHRIKTKCQRGITLEIRRRTANDGDMNEDILIALKELKNTAD